MRRHGAQGLPDDASEEDINVKILVLGFSVTAEKDGYVELAKANLPAGADLQIEKVGFGGMQPYHGRYLFPGLIADHAPDVVVLDHSTPAFRNFSVSREPYQNAYLSFLRECAERGIRLAVLDMPRTDVDYTQDWVTEYNVQICAQLGLPYKRIELTEGLLRDEVHPTDAGKIVYADALMDLIPRAAAVKLPEGMAQDVPRYGAVTVDRLAGASLSRRRIDRGGFVVDMVELPAGQSLEIDLGGAAKVCGLTSLMGPRTGALRLHFGGGALDQLSYDKFCYYERMGAALFGGQNASGAKTCSNLRVEQLPTLPDVELLKGTKDTSDRIGALGHILIER